MAGLVLSHTLAAMQEHMTSHEIPLTVQEAFSGIFGTISVVAWIFVFIPQLIENYRLGSGDAISMPFLLIWLAGDLANLIGALWAQLVPTVIAIGIYFCFADVLVLGQCFYYRIKNSRKKEQQHERSQSAGTANTQGTEEEPLLSRRDSNQSFGLPGSQRRRSSAASRRPTFGNADDAAAGAHGSTLNKIAEEEAGNNKSSALREAIKNTASVLLICGLGTAAWAICWQVGVWKPTPAPGQKHGHTDGEVMVQSAPVGAEILGYASAVLYLGARIPQIIKNYREQSCEGLSLLFFILSLLANLTYGAQILAHSLEKDYVLTNLPWLIGSLGTIAEDVTIFVQFRLYGDKEAAQQAASSSEAVE